MYNLNKECIHKRSVMYMSGPFSFLVGLFSLGAAAGMEGKSRSQAEREWEEKLEKGYDYSTQLDYDHGLKGDLKRIMREYDYMKMKAAIEKDYPRMTETMVHETICTGVRKRWMEEESRFKYEVPNKFGYINIDKYATDEFKRKV